MTEFRNLRLRVFADTPLVDVWSAPAPTAGELTVRIEKIEADTFLASAKAGSHTLLPVTAFDSAGIAELKAEALAYLTDPEGSWKQLLSNLAHRRIQGQVRAIQNVTTEAADARPHLRSDSGFTMLRFLEDHEAIGGRGRKSLTVTGPAQLFIDPDFQRPTVTAPVSDGDKILLYDAEETAAPDGLEAEIDRFNASPQSSLNALLRARALSAYIAQMDLLEKVAVRVTAYADALRRLDEAGERSPSDL